MTRILILAVIACTLLAGCSKKVETTQSSSGTDSASSDAGMAKDFAVAPEARAWVSDPNHGFFEISKDQGREIIEKLYSAGAVKVVIADAAKMDENKPEEIAATFTIELPAEAEKRKAIIKIINDLYEEEVVKDTGQKYVMLTTD